MSAKKANQPRLAIVPDGEISDADPANLIEEAAAAPYHTLLEVWRETLKHAAGELEKKVTPSWAMRITSMYKQLTIQEMDTFKVLYFSKIDALFQFVLIEIASDGDSLSYDSAEEDREENRSHYLELLLQWQVKLLEWELDWKCTDADAHIEVAAISEVHKMFFGETGLSGHLDAIGFQFEEADQQVISDKLEEMRGVNGE